ncbi:MAG: hypothetical protein HGA31_02225 [Candidatus Moranbacteria bacterium]|nr:hypothetical protein [Candidatus Moranbacteria bacterium]
MRIRLADSDYPEVVKMSLDKAIDGIDKIAGSMTDLLFTSEAGNLVIPDETMSSENTIKDDTEQVAGYETDGTSPESANGQSEVSDAVSGIDMAGFLSSDGLNVSGQDEAGLIVESDN